MSRSTVWSTSDPGLPRHEADNWDEQLDFRVDPDAIEARNDYVTDEVGTSSEGLHDYTVKRDADPGCGVPVDFGIPDQGQDVVHRGRSAASSNPPRRRSTQ